MQRFTAVLLHNSFVKDDQPEYVPFQCSFCFHFLNTCGFVLVGLNNNTTISMTWWTITRAQMEWFVSEVSWFTGINSNYCWSQALDASTDNPTVVFQYFGYAASSPPTDSIWAVTLLLRLRGKIIRITLCCCVWQLCTMISTLRRAVLTVLWIGFCHTGSISLCIDLFVFVCHVFYVLFYTAYVVLAYCEYGGVDLMGRKPSS